MSSISECSTSAARTLDSSPVESIKREKLGRMILRSRGAGGTHILLSWAVLLMAAAILADASSLAPTTAGGMSDEELALEMHDTVCSCLCCFQGGCVAVPNATFTVESCDSCSGEICQSRIVELDTLWRTTNAGRLVQRPPCLVLHISESQTCGRDAHCKQFTSIHAQCVDRGEYFQKYSCILWLTCVVGLVVRGFVKWIREVFFASSSLSSQPPRK